MRTLLAKTKEILLDILFPPLCLACEKSLLKEERARFLCASCTVGIPRFDTLFCATCRARLPEGKKICHRDAPFRLGAATSYDNDIVKHLIWKLKYEKHPIGAPPLAHLLIEYARALPIIWTDYIVISIPLHQKKFRERGFNQSELLGAQLAKALNIRFANILIRTRHTAPQAEMREPNKRLENVADCFALGKPDPVAGKKIILVDDVVTSGATLREAAVILKRNGAKDIIALVVAKAGF